MSEELRLCPFCGCKAQAVTEPFDPDDLDFMNFDDIDDSDCFDITCSNVHCINGWWLTPEQWNTRPIEDALTARIAELNEALRIRLVANDELPEAKESVLALVKEKWSGELYIERACYIPPETVRADHFFFDDLEDESAEKYDEELDIYWVAEGWWEDSKEANINWKISGEVIGWWSLPKIEVEG